MKAISRAALEIIAIAIIIQVAVYFGADRASFAIGMIVGTVFFAAVDR